jgi:hypothetical protein
VPKKKLEDVFKIGGIPTHTFVKPLEYQKLLVALRTPGRGVVIEGPSGIGKTTAVVKALEEIGLSSDVSRLSARKPDDVPYIKALPTIGPLGMVLIDDFHKLNDGIKQSIADFMKILADEERADSKLIVLGINNAGEALIRFAHDLNNRLDILTFETNPPEKIAELLGLGEAALNIDLNIKDSVVKEANGSFYLAQMLAHECCLASSIIEEQENLAQTKVSFELVRGKVFDRLARTFLDRTQRFARGPRFRPEGRAPYLHLLYWLSTSGDWVLNCARAARDNQTLRGSLTQVMEKGYLAGLISDDPELSAVLHYEEKSQQLSVEDPQYLYFLRNIAWSRFASDVGFVSTEFPSRYDFALSFAGPDRPIAEAIFEALVARECEVFYDRNEQHRIIAEDVEDYLRPIYQSYANYVIVLLGPEYPKRIWTRFESQQFKERFKDGAVIPVWFKTAPPGIFDESARRGGFEFDPTVEIAPQISKVVDVLSRKLLESRAISAAIDEAPRS